MLPDNFMITVMNRKGGVGKTPIAFTLAKDLDSYLVTNESTIVEAHYGEFMEVSRDPGVYSDRRVVYDLGGFLEKGVVEVVKRSQIVLVPVNNEYDAIKKTFDTLNELEEYNKNILLIATKTEANDFMELKKTFEERFFHPMLELKKSRIFQNATSSGKSLLELYEENPLSKSAYRTIIEQYRAIIQYIEENI